MALKAWAVGDGKEVSKDKSIRYFSTSAQFGDDTWVYRWKETVEEAVTQWKGLTEASALAKADDSSDDGTTATVFTANIDGEKTRAWMVTRTVTKTTTEFISATKQ